MRLQKYPDILLGWLNLKNEGRAPVEFGETVLPVIEVGDLYAHPDRTMVTNSAATALNTDLALLQPGISEAWRVKAISLVLARNVADIALSVTCNAQLRRNSAFGAAILSHTFAPVAATDLQQAFGLWLPRPLYMTPNDRLAVRVQTTLSVAGTVGITLDIDRLPL